MIVVAVVMALVPVVGWYVTRRRRRKGRIPGQWGLIEEHQRAMRAVAPNDDQPSDPPKS